MRMLEACVTTLETAQAAERGGANRVELCVDLAVGGTTPPRDLIAAVLGALTIPVHVLIRPRAGSFVYSAQELEQMREDILYARHAAAAGVVLGLLREDGAVDTDTTQRLVELARPMRVTFHRAFDETHNGPEALEAVIRTGADCLLTSGRAADVLAGAEELARLHTQAAGRIEVMAGGGLRLDNLEQVIRRTGVPWLHGSFTWRDSAQTDTAVPELLERRVAQAMRMLRRSGD